MLPSIEIIPETINQLERFKTVIDAFIQQINEYMKGVKRYENKEFNIEENIKSLDQQKLSETLLDQLEDIKIRNNLVLQQFDVFQTHFDKLKNKIDELKSKYLKDQENCKLKKKNFSEFLHETFETIKKNQENHYYQYEKQSYDIFYPQLKNIEMEFEEMKQLEKWTNKRCGEILFDSENDDWSRNTSVFDQKIAGKSNLLLYVEDMEKNKFGSYLSEKALEVSTDNKMKPLGKDSFLFLLKSNGRLDGMMKFEIQQQHNGYILDDKNNDRLIRIGFGKDCYIEKKDEHLKQKAYSGCYVNQSSTFDYHGLSNVLIGRSCAYNSPKRKECSFIPKRSVVIQMN